MPSSVHILNMSVENCCLLYAGDHTKISFLTLRRPNDPVPDLAQLVKLGSGHSENSTNVFGGA